MIQSIRILLKSVCPLLFGALEDVEPILLHRFDFKFAEGGSNWTRIGQLNWVETARHSLYPSNTWKGQQLSS